MNMVGGPHDPQDEPKPEVGKRGCTRWLAQDPRVGVALVAVQFDRPAAGMAAAAAHDRWHGIEDRLDEQAVVPVRGRDQHVQR